MENKNQIKSREGIKKKAKTLTLSFTGEPLQQPETIWKKSPEYLDFAYWMRGYVRGLIKKDLKNGKR